jgi:hypothetical protein
MARPQCDTPLVKFSDVNVLAFISNLRPNNKPNMLKVGPKFFQPYASCKGRLSWPRNHVLGRGMHDWGCCLWNPPKLLQEPCFRLKFPSNTWLRYHGHILLGATWLNITSPFFFCSGNLVFPQATT